MFDRRSVHLQPMARSPTGESFNRFSIDVRLKFDILFYSILFYSILFYSILFCSVLFCSILFYSIPIVHVELLVTTSLNSSTSDSD